MRDAPAAPAPGMICRYTDPDDNSYDCIVDEVEGTSAFIRYRPVGIVTVAKWVDYSSLSVPR